jgi:NitT/TauT family transport system ATP-binding protein/nitrate/nitrite transport system substrate-binding protein
MSHSTSPTVVGANRAGKLRIGLLRLSDSAPMIIAHEFGFFADEGVDVALTVEPSWANIADKLAFDALDAAVIVPPLAFAVQLGLRGVAQPMIVPYVLSVGGNSVTLSSELAGQVRHRAEHQDLSKIDALAACLRERPTTLGVVHAFSTHNLLFRYWLATAGIEAGRDVKLAVVPPARAVEALRDKQIAGFCAGAPWGEVARRAGVGSTIASTHEIWNSAPEKVFAVRARWAQQHPEALAGAMRALRRASRFCDDPQNAAYIAALLSRRQYVNLDPHAILASLPSASTAHTRCVFFRGAATFPWRSQGLWFLSQMRRWQLIDDSIDLRTLAGRVYRPDLYRAAMLPLDEPTPNTDWKIEGAHDAPWSLHAESTPLAMPSDRFCDGMIFDPAALPPLGEHAMRMLEREDRHDPFA